MWRNATYFAVSAAALLLSLGGERITAQEFEQEPIRYSQTEPTNRVSRLIERLGAGKTPLKYAPKVGYLPALLQELEVPVSSQTLVYSKTSMQRHHIAPRTPRALYFNDDVFVGYCQEGEVLEISVADPQLGAVFYTLGQDEADGPKITRQTDNCLTCHASSQTKDVPGYVLRSVFVDTTGLPILSAGTDRIDQTSPLEKRWGGWYVTGSHGSQKHRGNLVIRTRSVPDDVDNAAGQNVTALEKHFDASAYLSGHSDIVALMVLEHQADALNWITRANFLTRQAMQYQQVLNRELGEPADHVWDSTKSRIKSAGEPLVEYLLYSGEAKLTERIAGTTRFVADFSASAKRDQRGRSLRDFDLERRIFKYPCSYLIYSPSFEALPGAVKDYVWRRMWEMLSGQDQTKPFAHLSPDDRLAILEILRDTVPTLPDYWRAK